MIFIDNDQQLSKFCEEIASEPIISVDTEFYRRTTYFAKLSLIQIVSRRHKVIIDALAHNINLSLLKNIFVNDKTLKIFHSPREDFEILYYLFNQLPQNIFDTQIAASVCGLGNSLSYSELCEQICGVSIDKTYQKANWMKRPLLPKMLDYAIKDAEYLHLLYLSLQKDITDRKLHEAYQQRTKLLLDPKNYLVDLKGAWQKVKFHSYSEKIISRMQVLAAFREECASQMNIPRRYFASDEDLIKLCEHLPTTEKQLKHLNLDSYHLFKSKYKNRLIELCLGLAENT